MCEARQEAIFHEQYVQKQLKEKNEQLAQKDALIAQLQSELASLRIQK